jgi:hypothetical protein
MLMIDRQGTTERTHRLTFDGAPAARGTGSHRPHR